MIEPNGSDPTWPAWLVTFFEDPQLCPRCGKRQYMLETIFKVDRPSTYEIRLCDFDGCEDHCACHLNR